MLVLLLLIMSGIANATPDIFGCDQFYLVTNSTDRCMTTDCICRARPGPRPNNPQTAIEIDRRYSVYFPTAVHEITENQSSDMESSLTALENFFPSANATVIAYTDACGSMEYNTSLARRRLTSALEEVGDTFRVSHTMIHPEASTVCPNQSARRIDVIVHTSRQLTTMIDKVPADVYLVDASGSMWPDWRHWTDIINASYKPGAKIYVSMTSGCRNGQILNDIEPQGGTEIWYAYWRVLDFMRPGETLAIISDFQSDIPLTTAEHRLIRDKVIEKEVRVIIIRP